MKRTLEDILNNSHKASLFPTLPESKKEERATSILLAAFRVVPQFAADVFKEAGFPASKKPKVECYTEVSFDENNNTKNDKEASRPDGLICVSYNGRQWVALIESKIGNNEHTQEQLERYLDIAREYSLDAVISISNQFVSVPSHHPVKINKTKTKSVGLFHYSWLSILAKALILIENAEVDDPEQAFIIEELVRYFENKESGVTTFIRMNSSWKAVVLSVQQKTKLNKTSPEVIGAVDSWQQLQKYLALHLSQLLKQHVYLHLSRTRSKDAQLNLKMDVDDLVSVDEVLRSEFSIPNAASKLKFEADFARRNITFSMKLEAPKDKKFATASINWLTRQLKDSDYTNIDVSAQWPGKTATSQMPLVRVIEDPTCLIPDGIKNIPLAIEVSSTTDMAGKFSASSKFVEIVVAEIDKFYQNVGQSLSPWIAKPPKMPSRQEVEIVVSQDSELVV
jgi:hypothetical protein